MKRGTIEHPKTGDLANKLGVSLVQAVGHLEALWHFSARYAIQGDVGKWGDEEIARGCLWDGEPTLLIKALLDAGWLDHDSRHRLVVHDWPDHADQSVKKTLGNRGLEFIVADGVELVGKIPPDSGNGQSGRSSPPSLSLPVPSPSKPMLRGVPKGTGKPDSIKDDPEYQACVEVCKEIEKKRKDGWTFEFLGRCAKKNYRYFDVMKQYLVMIREHYLKEPSATLYKLWNSGNVRQNMTGKANEMKHLARKVLEHAEAKRHRGTRRD